MNYILDNVIISMLFFGYGNGLTSYLVRECRMHAEMS